MVNNMCCSNFRVAETEEAFSEKFTPYFHGSGEAPWKAFLLDFSESHFMRNHEEPERPAA
jgi:hypothetical protein